MIGSRYASLSRTPKPRATVECGSYSNPNNGCTDEREDAIAAYTDALAWYITGVTKGLGPVTEVAFNALNGRLGIAMANTQTYTLAKRPQGSNNLFVAWETLTHAGNPA